jgi:ubiquinone/menaquinone biosynthesis C-methylase UbiE
MKEKNKSDLETANAFARSWNNLPSGSVYSREQFEEWFEPVVKKDVEGKTVLELGCGNCGLMYHVSSWNPSYLEGVDLGDSILSGEKNMQMAPFKNWKIVKEDLVEYKSQGFDFVYCIGVLHHLKDPQKGFESVVRNTKKGGFFHCWVYAKEGNSIIIYIVDPIRKIVCHFPWWVTKYLVATPLVVPYYLYAKFLNVFKKVNIFKNLPLYKYSIWIAKRDFAFFRHVAFDQLVTPQTAYIEKSTIEEWLSSNSDIEKDSVYIIQRNGISWKFGGRVKAN